MLTLLQAQAILSILIAFGVPQITVDKVQTILIPPQATSTPITTVPVIQTPVVENQPLQFGSIVPPPPAPICDDIPSLSYKAYLFTNGDVKELSEPIVVKKDNADVMFGATVSSCLQKKWKILATYPRSTQWDWSSPSLEFRDHLTSGLDISVPGVYTVYLQATDGATTATTSISIEVQ